MYTVVHAFPEEDETGRAMHLRYWYGTVRPAQDQDDEDNPVVCWCGGRHVRISEKVIAVWHTRSYYVGPDHG